MPPIYRDFQTQAEIDAQYNPSLKLANPAAAGQHYVTTAQRARDTLPCHLDVPYGPTLAETLDIFPASQPNAPVFVFIHGGYWRAFTSKEFSGVALGLNALGITTVVVNYALCPSVSLDEITRQARASVAWVVRNIAGYGGDASRVAIGGHSAGAHLAAMCLQTPWAQDYGLPQNPIAAALLFSGLYDLTPLRYSYLQPQIQLDEGIIQRNSPAFRVRACPTPTWITWGGEESTEFARQSQVLHTASQALGNATELSPIAGADHFTVIHGLESADSAASRWLHQKLNPATPHETP
jgi:arylformamidase